MKTAEVTIVDRFVGTNIEYNNIFKKFSHILTKPPPFPQSNVDKNLIHCGDYCDTYCYNIVLVGRGEYDFISVLIVD